MSDDPIKDALNMMPYGFYSITSKSGDDVNAMVANWVVQVSFTPRLIALALAKKAHSHSLVTEGRVFAVNLFRKEDVDLIRPYSKGRAKNPAKMEGVEFSPAPITGCPVLPGVAAVIECRVTQVYDSGGDHSLVVGEVIAAQVFKASEVEEMLTLAHIGWSYAG